MVAVTRRGALIATGAANCSPATPQQRGRRKGATKGATTSSPSRKALEEHPAKRSKVLPPAEEEKNLGLDDVCEALVDDTTLDYAVPHLPSRKLLSEALPYAVRTPPSIRANHQNDILKEVRDVLANNAERLNRLFEDGDEEAVQLRAKVESCKEDAATEAKQAEIQLNGIAALGEEMKAKIADGRERQSELEAIQHQLKNRNTVKDKLTSSLQRCEAIRDVELAAAEAATVAVVATVTHGSDEAGASAEGGSADERKQKILLARAAKKKRDDLITEVKRLGAEPALVFALGGALPLLPAERGAFASSTLSALTTFLGVKAADFQNQLQALDADGDAKRVEEEAEEKTKLIEEAQGAAEEAAKQREQAQIRHAEQQQLAEAANARLAEAKAACMAREEATGDGARARRSARILEAYDAVMKEASKEEEEAAADKRLQEEAAEAAPQPVSSA
jgi:hypothetical protein